MQTILSATLGNTIIAAAITVVAAAVYRFSHRPALAHALWVIVLIKLITPPLFSLPLLANSPSSVERTAVAVADVPTAFVANRVPSTVTSREFNVVNLLSFAWVLGSLGVVGLTIFRLNRFRNVLGHARQADEDDKALTQDVGRRLGIRSLPKTFLLPGRVCPMVWAAPWKTARLLLPDELWRTMARSGREKLIAHELAHLYRGDHRVRWLELVTSIVFWWNPVLWVARIGLHEAEEDCCDAWVARIFHDGRDDYASALLSAIEFASQPRTLVLASGIGHFRSLNRRVLMIQSGNVNPVAGRAGVLCICAAALLIPISYGSGHAATADGPAPAATQSARDAELNTPTLQKLDKEIPDIKCDHVNFADVIDLLRDVSSCGIVVRWDGLKTVGIDKNTPVSINLQNPKFKDALSALLISAAGKPGVVGYAVSRGQIVILPVGENPELANRLASGTKVDNAMQAKLNQKVSLIYDDAGLADILNHLQGVIGVKIVMPWDQLKAAGVEKSTRLEFHFRDETFGDALSAILAEAGGKPGILEFTIEKGDIVVVVKGIPTTRSRQR